MDEKGNGPGHFSDSDEEDGFVQGRKMAKRRPIHAKTSLNIIRMSQSGLALDWGRLSTEKREAGTEKSPKALQTQPLQPG